MIIYFFFNKWQQNLIDEIYDWLAPAWQAYSALLASQKGTTLPCLI